MNTAMATFKFSKPLLNVTHADMTCGGRECETTCQENGNVVAMLSFYICLAPFSLLYKIIFIALSPWRNC